MTDGVLLQPVVRWWHCPSCDLHDRTERSDAHSQFHACPALGGVTIPLVEVRDADTSSKARQVVVQSEYGYETSSVRTERFDGSNDVTVFAQPAKATLS